jgi:dienelactone hydrolase
METTAPIHCAIPVSGSAIRLPADLTPIADAAGLIIFAHGSGSSRRSPRNRYVAGQLVRNGFTTLLFDLLTEDEGADRANVFDIPLLAGRVADALDWARTNPRTRDLPIGLFGASTGAAAALEAAAQRPAEVAAVVSRGGRPDLAGPSLANIRASVLLIVGGSDRDVIKLNEEALAQMTCPKRLDIVPGATHLFEEPGALDAVVHKAAIWFADTLRRRARAP